MNWKTKRNLNSLAIAAAFTAGAALVVHNVTKDRVSEPYPDQIVDTRWSYNTSFTHTLFDLAKKEMCMLGTRTHHDGKPDISTADITKKSNCTPFAELTEIQQAQKSAAYAKVRKI